MGKSIKPRSEERTVCAIARGEALTGNEGELEALLRDLAFAVQAEEAGCTSYLVTRALGSRAHFAVHAHFADMRAFQVHAETPHFKRAMPRIQALLAEPITMELFFAV